MDLPQMQQITEADFSLKVLALDARAKELQADVQSLARYALWQVSQYSKRAPADALLASFPKAFSLYPPWI